MWRQQTTITVVLAILIAFATAASRFASTQVTLESTPPACPVTRRPARPFVPPSPYPATPGPNSFWFGTEKLWTALPADGAWNGLPHYTPEMPEYRQKLFWWREDYHWLSEPNPPLLIRGRRLNGLAVFTTTCASNGFHGDWQSFMVAGIDIPTLGCWEITGEYKGDKLTYVIWVGP